MKYRKQPKDSSQCGQACVAMVLNIPLKRCIKEIFFGWKGNTSPKLVSLAIRSRPEFYCSSRVTHITDKRPAPDRCIIQIQSTLPRHKNWSHWILKWDGHIYDPHYGVDPVYDKDIVFHGFLRITPGRY